MAEDEQLIAEQIVINREQALTVRISQDTVEDFYRVEVTNPAVPQRYMTATVSPGDSFMIDLIRGAVSGDQVAWRHLASWGRDNLPVAGLAPRRCFS